MLVVAGVMSVLSRSQYNGVRPHLSAVCEESLHSTVPASSILFGQLGGLSLTVTVASLLRTSSYPLLPSPAHAT